MLKTVVLLMIFILWNCDTFFFLFFDLQYKSFATFICTPTFDQFNASLLNNNKKLCIDPKSLTGSFTEIYNININCKSPTKPYNLLASFYQVTDEFMTKYNRLTAFDVNNKNREIFYFSFHSYRTFCI